MRGLIAVVTLVVLARPALAASPTERLAKAGDDFRSRKYADAIMSLRSLLYPPPGRLAEPKDIVEAHLLLGVSLFETGEVSDGTLEIEAALYIEPSAKLDDKLFSAAAVRWFNETKAAKDARDKAAADARALAEDKEKVRRFLESRVGVEKHQYWVNFMPFGAGQFQNGDTRKGIFFAATEAAAAGTSIAIFAYLTNKYGYRGTVPREEAPGALRLQQISIGANVVFYGVFIWGVVDALRNYKATAEFQFDESQLPDDLQDLLKDTKRKPKKPDKPTSRLFLHPLPFPGGAGVGLTWEH